MSRKTYKAFVLTKEQEEQLLVLEISRKCGWRPYWGSCLNRNGFVAYKMPQDTYDLEDYEDALDLVVKEEELLDARKPLSQPRSFRFVAYKRVSSVPVKKLIKFRTKEKGKTK